MSLEKNYSPVTNWDYYLLDVILGGQLKLGYLIYDFWRGVSGNQETPLNPPLGIIQRMTLVKSKSKLGRPRF